MNESTDALRVQLKERMEELGVGYRQLARLTGRERTVIHRALTRKDQRGMNVGLLVDMAAQLGMELRLVPTGIDPVIVEETR